MGQGRRSRNYEKKRFAEGAPAPHGEEPRPDLIYGRRPVWEVLRAGKRDLHKLWLVRGTAGGVVEEIISLAKGKGVAIDWVDVTRMDYLVKGNHQGVVAQVSAATFLELDTFLKGLAPEAEVLLLGLDEIEDPQNIGAILRNAGFFGVHAVLLPRWRSAPVSEAAVRVSAGAAEHMTMIRVGNLVQSIDQLKEAGFEVWGADMAGEPLWQQKKGKRMVLILGSEGKGMRRLVKEHCDKLVGIPSRTPVGSLNVAATSAIFLYELFRGASK